MEAQLTARAPRTNLLLSAAIEAGALRAPVRIRNLSDGGAMVEGSALPHVGADAVLKRLDIAIGATVVWRANGRCGLRFDGEVSVEDWIAGHRAAAATLGAQSHVDAIQRAIRAGAMPIEEARPVAVPAPAGHLDLRIAEELGFVGRMLDAVGDALTDDPMILQLHMQTLQNLDVATQILGHLRDLLTAADKPAAIDRITMGELRGRLNRKPLFATGH